MAIQTQHDRVSMFQLTRHFLLLACTSVFQCCGCVIPLADLILMGCQKNEMGLDLTVYF